MRESNDEPEQQEHETRLERLRQQYEARSTSELGLRVQEWNRIGDGFTDIARMVVDELGEAYMTIHTPIPESLLTGTVDHPPEMPALGQLARLWTNRPQMDWGSALNDGYIFGRATPGYLIFGTSDPYFGIHTMGITSLELKGNDHDQWGDSPESEQERTGLVTLLQRRGVIVRAEPVIRARIECYRRNISFYHLRSTRPLIRMNEW